MIRILTDSVSAISKEVAAKKGIEVVSLHVLHNDTDYLDFEMDIDGFYSSIGNMLDNIPTSSQPSRAAFTDIFEDAIAKGDEVLGVFISHLFSGTRDSAISIASELKASHPEFSCAIVDAASNSYDEGFAVLNAVAARDEGKSLGECARAALSSVSRSRILFAPESLAFLEAGGRVGKAASLIGNMLKVSPVITVINGESEVFTKVRTSRKALAAMFEAMKADTAAHGLRDVVVHYIGEASSARKWARDVISPFAGFDVPVIPVSPVIGVHVGPAVGVAYECERPIGDKYTNDLDSLLTVI